MGAYTPAKASRLLTKDFVAHLSSRLPNSRVQKSKHRDQNRIELIQTKGVLYAIGVQFGRFSWTNKKIRSAIIVATKFCKANDLTDILIHVIVLTHKDYVSAKRIIWKNLRIQVLNVLEPTGSFENYITEYDLARSYRNLVNRGYEVTRSIDHSFSSFRKSSNSDGIWSAIVAGAAVVAYAFLYLSR
ncbi:hypothetical protein GEMRC1_009834 [Eukaryota sp. GEM-RC1]